MALRSTPCSDHATPRYPAHNFSGDSSLTCRRGGESCVVPELVLLDSELGEFRTVPISSVSLRASALVFSCPLLFVVRGATRPADPIEPGLILLERLHRRRLRIVDRDDPVEAAEFENAANPSLKRAYGILLSRLVEFRCNGQDDSHARAAEERHLLEVEDQGLIRRIDSALQHVLEQARAVVADKTHEHRDHDSALAAPLDIDGDGFRLLSTRTATEASSVSHLDHLRV